MASDSVLSQAELEALNHKMTTSQVSLLTQLLHEYRSYWFIAFTMLLAVYVYLLTHKRLEDDVT